jgi:hypothetical protein
MRFLFVSSSSACQLPKPLEDEKRGGKGEIIDPFVRVKVKSTIRRTLFDDNDLRR